MIAIRRSDWTKLSWQEAQETVVKMLQEYGFMVFNEKQVYNGRVDGVVIKRYPSKIIIGIIEVKHYKKVSNSVREKAMFQSLKYLRSVFDDMSRRYPQRMQRYFLATVFTNDYPTSGNTLFIRKFKDQIPQFIKDRAEITVLGSTPDQFISVLKKKGVLEAKQQTLDEFFK